MAVDRAAILLRVPALAGAPDGAEWATAIADAQLQVAESAWGALYELGVVYLAAHFVSVNHPELVPPQVQSVSVGGVSRSYAVTPARGQLDSTPAGREHARLRRSLCLGASLS